MHTQDSLQDDEFDDLSMLAAFSPAEGVPLVPTRVTVPVGERRLSGIVWNTERARADGADARLTFLHGLGNEAHVFDPTVIGIGSPAVALDLPGHGRSSWRDDARYSAQQTAPDILNALDTLMVPPSIVVGHSLGAILATRIAAAAPERVTGVVLIDMSPDFTQRGVERIVRALEYEAPLRDREDAADRAIENRVADDRAALLREARHATRLDADGALVRRHHFPHLPAGLHADVGRFADAWPDLESIRVPVLLVRGDHGYVSQRLGRLFSARVPGATIVTVPARHAVPTQAPAELAAAIVRWRDAHDL